MTNQTPADVTGPNRFGKTFLVLFALGLPGVLTLIPMVMNQSEALPVEFMDLPTPVVIALSLLNPLILMAVAVAAGVMLAHRVGLRSLVAERVRQGAAIWPQLRPQIPMAFVAGLVFAVVVLGLDALINPFANTDLANGPAVGETATIGALLTQLVMGLFYGGIVEELMLRWGMMTLLVWTGWRLLQRGQGLPRPALVWAANILAAILFGIGHLPALATMVTLTPLIIFRTVLLNALGGVLFGWLFWRRNLETAMVAHGAVHVGFLIMNAGQMLLNLG